MSTNWIIEVSDPQLPEARAVLAGGHKYLTDALRHADDLTAEHQDRGLRFEVRAICRDIADALDYLGRVVR